jgi:hypothetical protein
VSHHDYRFDLANEGDDHKYRALFFASNNKNNNQTENSFIRPKWNLEFFYSPNMLTISEDDPLSQLYVKNGLPQLNGKVLVDTMYNKIVSNSDIEKVISECMFYLSMKKNLLLLLRMAFDLL